MSCDIKRKSRCVSQSVKFISIYYKMNSNFAIFILAATIVFGIACMYNRSLPTWYVTLTTFIVLKMVFKYNKCTVSYIECKLWGVKKEQGCIYRTLQSLMDLPPMLIVVAVIHVIVICVHKYAYGL